MNDPETSRTIIGFRTAMILYTVLTVVSFVVLRGTALVLALLIVFALAVKSYVYHLRSRID